MASVTAYPYARWPKWTREQVLRVRRCVRRLPLARAEQAARQLGELLGAEMAVHTEGPQPMDAEQAWERFYEPLAAAVVVSPRGARVVIEIDPALALDVVDRALGGEGGTAPAAGELQEAERGVLGYVLARALGAASERPWHVATVVTRREAVRRALGDAPLIVWPAEVALGSDRGALRVWLPQPALDALPPEGASARRARGLTTLPLAWVAQAGTATLSTADVRSLRCGDVVVLDEAWVRPDAERWAGSARTRIAGAMRTTWWCELDPEGLRLRSTQRTEQQPKTEGRRMQREDKTDEVVAQAGDAPVELVVELARFEMPLEEIASLRAGEIVATGRAVGERVTLRAGERAIATGELVDVDGEVGVRVLQLSE